VSRFSRHLAGSGYIVAAPSSYHEFTSPAPLAYDVAGTDAGNEYKITKKVSAYDEDADLAIATLLKMPSCTGRIGATGMCLGGHLAYRCAFSPHIRAAVCYFATDIHSHSLGAGQSDDSLHRAKDIKGEMLMIFGKRDNHVPAEGRDLIRKTLHEAGVEFSWYEVAGAQHAFIRDELSKGRFDPRVSGVCWAMLEELFERRLKIDLGEEAEKQAVEDVC
jgi:dienelactone hydrolase